MNRTDLLLAGAGLLAVALFAGWNYVREASEVRAQQAAAEARAQVQRDDRAARWAEQRESIADQARAHMQNAHFDAALAVLAPWDDLLGPEERGLRNAVRRLKEQAEATAAPAAVVGQAAKGWEPRRSAWDGTYPEVVSWVENAAVDRDSIEFHTCTPAVLVQAKWKTTCRWSWKNRLGARLEQSLTFLLVDGFVVETF